MTDIMNMMQEAQTAAIKATNEFLSKNGDRDMCGFAWLTVREKGSTKLGRALLANGFTKAYGGGLQWWNPSGNYTQSIIAKEIGAGAAATVFKKYGIEAYADSRMD